MTARPWALVTGGARRLGRALVDAAANEGWAVAVHANRSIDAGQVTVADLESRGVPSCLVTADLADAAQAAELIPRLAANGKAPQLLVNNAALFTHDRLGTATADGFDAHMALNLRAPLLLARAFAEALPADAEGQIVNMIDQRIHRNSPHYLTYTMAKAGLWSLTRMLAVELAPKVRVNGIGPGIALPDAAMSDDRAEALVADFPLRHGGSVDEVATAFRYLVNAGSVTGQMICVDGGAHLAVPGAAG
jgi:NAD(P)-dependent dehydrogenase (short-subunit alcohol dehydrogenase family)